MECIRLLASTISLRPYVFLFLAAYLILAVPSWGWRRTILYALLGYSLAWGAEYSSSHGGTLFSGILMFNLWMTFMIGEILLGLLGCALSVYMLAPVMRRMYAKIPAVSPG